MNTYLNVNEVLENLVGNSTMRDLDDLCRETIRIADAGGDMKEGILKNHYRKIMIMQLEMIRDLIVSPLDSSIKELKQLTEEPVSEISDDEIREL